MGLFDTLKPQKKTFYTIQYTLKKCEGIIVRVAYDIKPFAYKIYDEECIVTKLLNGKTPTGNVQ